MGRKNGRSCLIQFPKTLDNNSQPTQSPEWYKHVWVRKERNEKKINNFCLLRLDVLLSGGRSGRIGVSDSSGLGILGSLGGDLGF